MNLRWRLEIRTEKGWMMVGVYGVKSVPQMAAAYGRFAANGLKPYADIRVVRVRKND